MEIKAISLSGLFLASYINCQQIIASGQGSGTFYYDIDQVEVCNDSFENMIHNAVGCSQSYLSLASINSNYVVAMNNTLMRSDPIKYCGKKVVVTVNGKKADMPLFIGDGCERCYSVPILDFSYSVLNELAGGTICDQGHIPISWEILDDTLYDFQNGPAFVESFYDPVTSTSSATVEASKICTNNAWQCNGNVMEQCYDSAWHPRVTCSPNQSCQGGTNPYCI